MDFREQVLDGIRRRIGIASGGCGIDMFNSALKKESKDAMRRFLSWFEEDYSFDNQEGKAEGALASIEIKRFFDLVD